MKPLYELIFLFFSFVFFVLIVKAREAPSPREALLAKAPEAPKSASYKPMIIEAPPPRNDTRVPLVLELLGVTQEQWEEGDLNVSELLEKAKDPDLFDEDSIDLEMIDEDAFDMDPKMFNDIDPNAFDFPVSPEELAEMKRQMILDAKQNWLEEVKRSMIENAREDFHRSLIDQILLELESHLLN